MLICARVSCTKLCTLMGIFVQENASVETCIVYHFQRAYVVLKSLCSAEEHISVLGMSKF